MRRKEQGQQINGVDKPNVGTYISEVDLVHGFPFCFRGFLLSGKL